MAETKGPGEPKTLEMRVAELEDKLSHVHISEEEMQIYQKVAAKLGAAVPCQQCMTPPCVAAQAQQPCVAAQQQQPCVASQQQLGIYPRYWNPIYYRPPIYWNPIYYADCIPGCAPGGGAAGGGGGFGGFGM